MEYISGFYDNKNTLFIDTNGICYRKIEPIIKTAPNQRQQKLICINKKKIGLATLLAEFYIPNPKKYTKVCFKDDNPLNCSINNIAWISDQQFYELRNLRKKNIGGRPKIEYDIETCLLISTDSRIKDAIITRDFNKLWLQIANKIRIKHFHLVEGEVYEYFIERMKRNSITGNPFVWVLKCSRGRIRKYFQKRYVEYNEIINLKK